MESERILTSSATDFTKREFWDDFFKERSGRPFEWYGDWEDLTELLAQHCELVPTKYPPPRILVPGCGNSDLSARMYDAGFKHIVNIDFSKVVIAEMLRHHIRARPEMVWRIMDMTQMQFPNDSFDIVLDKGGLDALLGEPEQETTPAINFLSEAKRVLRVEGRYACVTLAQKHVIVLLLSNFRHGWQISIHRVPQLLEKVPSELRPFLVVAKKADSIACPLVTSSFDRVLYTKEYRLQMDHVKEAIDEENKLRILGISNGSGEQMQSIMVDALENIVPGRRISVTLVGKGLPQLHYEAVVLDAPKGSGPFKYKCAVFLVQKGRAHEWLFSSKEGQWQVLESAKAGRLIMVFLDINFYLGSTEAIQDDLSPLVQKLLPSDCKDGGVPYLTSGDGVAQRTILEEIESSLTGVMLVEDVVLSEQNNDKRHSSAKQECFRRLVFRRNPNLIQSEALLLKGPLKDDGKTKFEGNRRHKSTKKKSRIDKDRLFGSSDGFQVDHSFLASPYHSGMVTGLALIASNLEKWILTHQSVRAVVVGLGAGLLPMFLHEHLPFNEIQVIELDPVVVELAKRHFGFVEDERMELSIGDGVSIVKEIAKMVCDTKANCSLPCVSGSCDMTIDICCIRNETSRQAVLNGECSEQEGQASSSLGRSSSDDAYSGLHGSCNELAQKLQSSNLSQYKSNRSGFHILFVDADCENPSTGLSCPPPEFLQESFFQAVRDALIEGGILVINLVARTKAPHTTIPATLKKVFVEVYHLEIDEDVNRVLFALPHESGIKNKEGLLMAASTLERLAKMFASWGSGPNLKDIAAKLKML